MAFLGNFIKNRSGLIELAETKKVMTKTVKSLDQLANTGDEQITGLAQRIRANLDREDARLEMATANVSDQIDEAIRGTPGNGTRPGILVRLDRLEQDAKRQSKLIWLIIGAVVTASASGAVALITG